MNGERVGLESTGGVRVERLPVGAAAPGGDFGDSVWLVGDDEECVLIDAAGGAAGILAAVGARRLTAVLCTHAHAERVVAVPELLEAHPRMRIGLHPDDLGLWEQAQPALHPSLLLADGDTVTVGDIELTVRHTPGHTPGSCCFHAPDLAVLFVGDAGVRSAGLAGLDVDADTLVLPGRGPTRRLGTASGDER